jgi:hypothetical protein
MNIFFQLWDTTTGNLVTEFDSEDKVIEVLSGVWAEDGDEPLLEFALFRFQNDRPTLVAKESGLISYIARAQMRRDIQVVEGGVNSPNRKTTTIDLYGVEIQGARVHREGSRWAFFWRELEPRAMPFGAPVTATLMLEGGGRVAAA